MKNSVPTPVVVIAIVVVLAAVGFFAMRTMGSSSSSSTNLGGKMDAGAVQNISQKDVDQMKAEMAKARAERGETTK